MKKFFTKTLIFLIIVASIIGFLNHKYINTLTYQVKNASYKFYHIPEKLDIANLGNSLGQYALVYEDTGLQGFNFGLPAQRLYYDYKFFEENLDRFKEDSVLIIPLSYISFYLPYEGENFEEFNKVYYKFFSYKDMLNPQPKEYIKYGLLPILTADKDIEYVFFPENEEVEIPAQYPNYSIGLDKMIEESEDTSRRHKDFIEGDRPMTEEHIRELEKIIDLALANGIRPILISTPLTDLYSDKFSSAFKEDFQAKIEEVQAKYEKLEYWDYSHDARFRENYELFLDSSHLNLSGAKLFTQILLENIKESLN